MKSSDVRNVVEDYPVQRELLERYKRASLKSIEQTVNPEFASALGESIALANLAITNWGEGAW
jgi:hypothetical protein